MHNKDKKENGINEIDLSYLFSILWAKKFSIILLTSFFAVFSIFYALSIPNYYQSKALLNVILDDDNSLDTISAQYGGLVSLAGLDIPQVTSKDKASLVMETIKSREFIKRLIAIDGVLEGIIATKNFDIKTQKIIYDDKIFDPIKNEWVREAKYPYKQVPSYLEAHKIFIDDMLIMTQDRKSGFITLAIEHISPFFASYLLETIIDEVNFLIKEIDMNDSASAISYLNDQVELNLNNDLKDVVSRIYETQLRKQMLSNIRDEYIISPIDSPFVPEVKAGPTRSIICILITFLGGFLSIIYVLASHFFYIFNRQ